MRLIKVEGIVNLVAEDGNVNPVTENRRLHNGDTLTTGKESLAGISLDDSKAAIMGENTEAEFCKDTSGKKLEIKLNEGNIFFSVDKKLNEDESFEIKSSNMVIGIRGTSGYISTVDADDERLTVTEGKVHVTGTNLSTGETREVDVSAGQQAAVYLYNRVKDSIEFQVDHINEMNIPKNALQALVNDDSLIEKVNTATGWDPDLIRKYSSEQDSQRHEQALAIYAPIIELYANLQRNQMYDYPKTPYNIEEISPYYKGLRVLLGDPENAAKGTFKYYVGDLSDTGTEQLLLAFDFGNDYINIIKLYSIKNGKPVDLLPNFAWGSHRTFTIHKHNIFLDEDGWDRPTYHSKYYRLCLDGSVFQTIEHITYEMTEEPYYTQTKNGITTRISNEEAREIMDSYDFPSEEVIWNNVTDFHDGKVLTPEANNVDQILQPLYSKHKEDTTLHKPSNEDGAAYPYYPTNDDEFHILESGQAINFDNYGEEFPINLYKLPDYHSEVIDTVDRTDVTVFLGTYEYYDSYMEPWIIVENHSSTDSGERRVKGYIPAYTLFRNNDYTPVDEMWQTIANSGIPDYIQNDLVGFWPDDEEPLISAGESVYLQRLNQTSTTAYESPDDTSEIIDIIPSGSEIVFMGTYHYDWVLISYNGKNAFIKTSDLLDSDAN